VSEWVSEWVDTYWHICIVSAVHIGTHWKIQHSRQTKNTDTLQKLNTTQKKQTMQKYSKTKLPWFSRLIWHSTRKRGGLILQRSQAHTGHVSQETDHVETSLFPDHCNRCVWSHMTAHDMSGLFQLWTFWILQFLNNLQQIKFCISDVADISTLESAKILHRGLAGSECPESRDSSVNPAAVYIFWTNGR